MIFHSTTRRLKHSSNIESVENVLSSNVVEFEYELRHIPNIWHIIRICDSVIKQGNGDVWVER